MFERRNRMIIIGYQGIGKTTFSLKKPNVIDLESSSFFINGKRPDDWQIPYCNVAEHLSGQGYDVFVSSHDVVREELKNRETRILCIAPEPSTRMRELWLKKLKERVDKSKLEKDQRAFDRASTHYIEDVCSILSSGFDNVVINDIDYNLEKVINAYKEEFPGTSYRQLSLFF